MDQILLSLGRACEAFVDRLGVGSCGAVGWLVLSGASLVLLIAYLLVRYLVLQRKPQVPVSGVPSSSGQEAAGSAESVGGVVLEAGQEEGRGRVPCGPREGEEPTEDSHPASTGGFPLGTPVTVRPEEPQRLVERLRGRLARTHDQLIGRLDGILSGTGYVRENLLEELEEVLVTADLGVKTSYALLAAVREDLPEGAVSAQDLKDALRQRIRSMLDVGAEPLSMSRQSPFVIMVVGVNGVGKTTSIGKLAARARQQDRSVMLVAADTFRAAAIEQLEVWARRVGADLVKHKPGSDPAAVVFDAIQAARARGTDVVIVDTAGRLHTKTNLMEELKKIKRIMGRELEGAPHEVLLVLDATTGQNAIQQARTFDEALDVTGIILTKLDGTAKGGVVVGISHELRLPVRFIGIGEQIEDLREFDPDLFLEAIFSEPGEAMVH